jgi:hypothetical protein
MYSRRDNFAGLCFGPIKTGQVVVIIDMVFTVLFVISLVIGMYLLNGAIEEISNTEYFYRSPRQDRMLVAVDIAFKIMAIMTCLAIPNLIIGLLCLFGLFKVK